MTRPACFHTARASRRAFLGGAAATFAASGVRADDRQPFRVGTLPFGTAHWVIQTIKDNGLDAAAGLRIENVPLASSEAARIAFLSRSVDTVVNDLLFAARLKAEGKSILFLPYSSTEGGLMVPAASPIKGIADLKGKSIGVAGGPLDKSWLLLRAASAKQGLDLVAEARPVYGAPPLLAAKLETGELDCGLLYWSACARLQAKGYRQVFTVEDLAAMLGAKGKVSLVGFLLRPEAPQATLKSFAQALRAANATLTDKPEAWTRIRPLMEASSDATFDALKSAFVRGVPRKPRGEEIADAQAFYAIVAKLGGPAVVGDAASLPADLYVDQSVYG